MRLLRFRGHFALATTAALLFLVPAPASSQASPYVPTLDAAYEDLDALIRVGLVRGLVLGQRPYSRMAFARAAAAARDALGGGERMPSARFLEALDRLEAHFAREIGFLCDNGEASCPQVVPYAAVRSASFEGTFADSPPRPAESRITGGTSIDADIAPLLQRNRGRVLADGWTMAGEALVDFGLGTGVAAQLQPRFGVDEGTGGGSRTKATLMGAYLRGLLGNASFELGRNHVTQGHSRDLAPMLSSNSRPLNMVRVSMERPGRLPWIFRYLGPTSWSLTVADMGADRDIPNSKISVVEGSVRPHTNLELGLSLLSHQGGEGGPEATVYQRVRDVVAVLLNRRPFYWGDGDEFFSDKMLGVDARLTLPAHGLELYVEMATTDDHDLFKVPREVFWTEAALTGGLRISGLGAEGRTDLWAEVTHSGVRPYTHHQFTSGLAVDRRILGSALGPTAAGFQGGMVWRGQEHSVAVTGAWERYEGDLYHDPPPSPIQWKRLEDRPDEIRVRGTLDWVRLSGMTGLRTTLSLGYEGVTRFNFTAEDRANYLAQFRLDYFW